METVVVGRREELGVLAVLAEEWVSSLVLCGRSCLDRTTERVVASSSVEVPAMERISTMAAHFQAEEASYLARQMSE